MSVTPTGAAYASPLFAGLSGRRVTRRATADVSPFPLIVTLHGGTYSSLYFDLPAYSLLARAAALDVPVLAPDRPGYGESPLPPRGGTLRDSADLLAEAIGDGWRRYGEGAAGVVLVGHSIGAAIALMIAGEALDWPLIGLTVSGVGLHTPDESRAAWAALPDSVHVDLPSAVKDQAMFGPPGSYGPDMPALSHEADAPVPRAEILDIVNTWHDQAPEVLARVRAPVHYRQGEFDHLWIVDDGEVAGFNAALSDASRVDGALWRGTGHCIDFHRDGAALQVQQLGFALQCAAQARPA